MIPAADPNRCGSMGGKWIFPTKTEAKDALPQFQRDHGHGKVVRCFPNDHYHLTKDLKGRKGKADRVRRAAGKR